MAAIARHEQLCHIRGGSSPMSHVAIINKALAHVRPRFRLAYRDGIHGVGHWSRVWHHGRRLAVELEVNPAI